jgi:hypothetical protein
MKYLIGDKLMLNPLSDPKNEVYPIGLEASVLEYDVGTMYKLQLSTGGTVFLSEIAIAKYFLRKPKKSSLRTS